MRSSAGGTRLCESGRKLDCRGARYVSWIVMRLFALVALLAAACTPVTSDEPGPRVLLFTRTVEFRHESIGPAVTALSELARSAGGSADATEDPRVFSASGLASYDVVVFLMTTGDVLDPAQQTALVQFVRAGGGFAGVHSASDTEYDWPWYGELVGAYFAGHPTDPSVREGRLTVRAANHPATRGLPAPWVRSDEWYDLRDRQAGLTVLLDIDEKSYKTSAESPAPQPRPIAWYRDFDGGRSFYTALGHTTESWQEPLFLQHVWGGITAAAAASLPVPR
jgi:type 1 glutamine amidotransferase